jgi:hypothetical protein
MGSAFRGYVARNDRLSYVFHICSFGRRLEEIIAAQHPGTIRRCRACPTR